MNFTNRFGNNVLIILSFIILTISYGLNPFKITDDNYRYFDRSDEANILGRMVLSKQEGIFSRGAITGQYIDYSYSDEDIKKGNIPDKAFMPDSASRSNKQANAQLYNDYINDRKMSNGNFLTYKSQPGGQAIMYGVLQEIFPFDGGTNLNLFRLITIGLTALAFALFIGWTSRNFGKTVGVITFLFIFLTPWFFRFAFNLWWALWSFYIPFITILLILEHRKAKNKTLFDGKLLFYLFLSVFIKFFFTGAEFISSTLVAAVSPIIFYLFADCKNLRFGIIYFLKSCLVSCLAVILGLAQLAMQIRFLMGTWAAGFNHVIHSFIKQSPNGLDVEKTSVLDVLWVYMGETPFYWEFSPIKITLSFGFFALLFVVLCGVIYFFNKKITDANKRRMNLALIATTIISIIGPISWIVIFSAHAGFHVFLDFIVWYIPFFLYGYAVVGLTVKMAIDMIRKKV